MSSQRGRRILTVATYNVYANGKFFEERKDAIVKEIVALDAHVVCLQEATPEIIDLVEKALNKHNEGA